MNERSGLHNRKYLIIIGIIVLILMPVTTSFQYGLIDLLYAEQVGDVKAESVFSMGRKKLVSTKIICLQIINEDYKGSNLSYPGKVVTDPVKKEIYVVDSGNGRILIYASDFYPLLSIDKKYGIDSPLALAIDFEGYLFIAQSKSKRNKKGRISVLNPCLGGKKDIYFKGFEGADNFTPNNIAISNRGYLYVTGNSYRGVVVMDKNGTFSHLLTPVDRSGESQVVKARICDVEIDNHGNIYLLSEDMGRIYVYDSQERYLFKFGQKGGSTGKLSRPRGITVDGDGERIYVIDYMRHTANAYSGDGQFLFEFGGKGWGKGWFQYPTDIAVDSLGNVLVVDTFNHRVQVLKIQETFSVEKVKESIPKITTAKEVPKAKIPEYYILTSNMNLREESNTNSRIIKLLRKGEEFQILDEHEQDELNQWYFIETVPGLRGWICGIYNGKAMFKRKFDKFPSIKTDKTKYVKKQKTINAITIIKDSAKELQIPAEEASEDDKKKQGIVLKQNQIAEGNLNQEVETGRLMSVAKMVGYFFLLIVFFVLFIVLLVLMLKRLRV
ncbi:MAG: SH3 domain-containing protein [Desulfobacteraceae bacterium]|nr:SH3 domain-containing protein [Desulfobacteraceae bacterium]MBC2718698.1 SH3 domain-containing protein [Desulfobacteraceae bacterium]